MLLKDTFDCWSCFRDLLLFSSLMSSRCHCFYFCLSYSRFCRRSHVYSLKLWAAQLAYTPMTTPFIFVNGVVILESAVLFRLLPGWKLTLWRSTTASTCYVMWPQPQCMQSRNVPLEIPWRAFFILCRKKRVLPRLHLVMWCVSSCSRMLMEKRRCMPDGALI